MTTILYRVESTNMSYSGVSIRTDEYTVTKETPIGWWLKSPSYGKAPKWMAKKAKRRFACATPEEAMESFRRRKIRQIGILENQLRNAHGALAQAGGVCPEPDCSRLRRSAGLD